MPRAASGRRENPEATWLWQDLVGLKRGETNKVSHPLWIASKSVRVPRPSRTDHGGRKAMVCHDHGLHTWQFGTFHVRELRISRQRGHFCDEKRHRGHSSKWLLLWPSEIYLERSKKGRVISLGGVEGEVNVGKEQGWWWFLACHLLSAASKRADIVSV